MAWLPRHSDSCCQRFALLLLSGFIHPITINFMKITGHKKGRPRKVEVVVISDVHLGATGAQARQLLDYLKSISPERIILNGDIVDIKPLRRSYWPKSHMRILKYLFVLMARGVKVDYITGNHDAMLHQLALFQHDTFRIQESLVLELDGKKCWFFHGDVLDVSLRPVKWVDKLKLQAYELLLQLIQFGSFIGQRLKGSRVHFPVNTRQQLQRAARFVGHFEQTCAGTAIARGYHYVLCGHVHHPDIRTITTTEGQLTYLNSGDWVDNLSALEYHQGQWQLYRYYQDTLFRDKKEKPVVTKADRYQLAPAEAAEMNLKQA